jgi:predicted transcriptional regulator of viral defense system
LNYISRKEKTCFLSLIILRNIMADSVYISSNITSAQLEFMKLLDEYEIDIFHLEEIETELNRKFDNINEILENLVHKGFLSRIERGKFCKAAFRDENVIGTFIVKKGVVAYWSALNLHGLTEQFPNTVFIQTPHKKSDKSIFGVNYKFIRIAEEKRMGIIKEGYGNHSYFMTDVEKTIVDCFDLPQYSGGYAELIRAFSIAQLSGEKMIAYCRAINNIAATKRIGFLAELFEKKGFKSFIRFAKDCVKDSYNPFDPQGKDSGSFNAEWKLRLNISKEALFDIANKQY